MESVDIWEPFLLSSRPTWVAIAVKFWEGGEVGGERENETWTLVDTDKCETDGYVASVCSQQTEVTNSQ